jgi:hypothetical protein
MDPPTATAITAYNFDHIELRPVRRGRFPSVIQHLLQAKRFSHEVKERTVLQAQSLVHSSSRFFKTPKRVHRQLIDSSGASI